MKKTIISLSIISLLAGCGGGGGGSSTPDDKKPAPKVDFPLKGATFDAANLKSTTLSVKLLDKEIEGLTNIIEDYYEYSTYQPVSEASLPPKLDNLWNHDLANSFFESKTTSFEDAALSKPKKDTEEETTYGAKLKESPFITFVFDADLDKQLWSLPDFIADGDFALAKPASYQAIFQAKLGPLDEAETQDFLEEYGFDETYKEITRCNSVSIDRSFDFSRSKKETITIKGKSIETWKMNVRDYVFAECEKEGTPMPQMIKDHRNSNSESVEVWYNPTLGIIKVVEQMGDKEAIIELVDFSISK